MPSSNTATSTSNLLLQLLSAWASTSQRSDATLVSIMEPYVGVDSARLILSVLSQVAATRAEVKAQREAGVEPARWVRRQLEAITPGLTDELESIVLGEHAGSLIDAALSAMFSSQEAFAELLPAIPANLGNLGALAQAFFEEEQDGGMERALAALVSTVVIKARQLTAPLEITAVVAGIELGLRTARTAFQLATGKLTLDGALERLEEDAAAAVGTLAARALTFGMQACGAMLGAALGQVVGLAPLGAVVGRQLGQLAGHTIAPHVETGVKQLTRGVLHKGITLVQETFQTARAYIRGIFNA